jgi:hypothetical protein
MHIFSASVTPEEVGAFWAKKVTRMVERAMAFREAGGAGQLLDVIYYDLVKEPMSAVERIYGESSILLTDGARRSMQEQRKRNRQHKYGVHQYKLEDFGVDRSRAEAGFEQYRSQFQLPYEDCSHGE